MLPQRLIAPLRWAPVRWVTASAALAAIVAVSRLWLHANPTTVALSLLLLNLLLAAHWGLRYAVVISVAATLCYNFFFLPPIGTLTVADPQNWLALLAFLGTSVIASRLSVRIREEATEARHREREVEILFALSREFLQTEKVAELLPAVPDTVARVTSAPFAVLYLNDSALLYRSGDAPGELDQQRLEELMLLRQVTAIEAAAAVPLHVGVRPRGVLVLGKTFLSEETLEALGGLVSISIDRAQALENAARSEAAKESERMRSLMLDSITHELRTPLTSIKASATAMLSSTQISPEDRHDLLTVIDEETDRLNRLVAQAVEMAQLDTREVRMNLRPASVEEVLRHGLEACSAPLAARTVTVSTEPHLPRVTADMAWLQKVICNLLENAAKYSPEASPIELWAKRENDSVAIGVTDHGMGIEPWDQVLVFEKFYRGRAQAERRPGTGMGLAICRAIMTAHGGSIRVSSTPGRGSTFSITLPVSRR